VKLGNNATDTCAILSEVYGGEALKNSSVFEWHKQFKESWHVKITNEDNSITFFGVKVSVHFEFIQQRQTVNQAYYVETVKRLREFVRRKRPEIWPNVWILNHDNAPAYKALCQAFSGAKINY
jgi:hypothetical protein